jgi:hypothetical protein
MPGSKNGAKQKKLLDRFMKTDPEFKQFKFDLAADLHERIAELKKTTGMTNKAMNDALNYAVRGLVTRLEREAKGESEGA